MHLLMGRSVVVPSLPRMAHYGKLWLQAGSGTQAGCVCVCGGVILFCRMPVEDGVAALPADVAGVDRCCRA